MASYDGNSLIFGVSSEIYSVPNPLRIQYDSIAGVNGRLAMNLGSDGASHVAEILLGANTIAGRVLLENVWKAYKALGPAFTSTLIDNDNAIHLGVYVLNYEPLERAHREYYWYTRRVRITFDQLL